MDAVDPILCVPVSANVHRRGDHFGLSRIFKAFRKVAVEVLEANSHRNASQRTLACSHWRWRITIRSNCFERLPKFIKWRICSVGQEYGCIYKGKTVGEFASLLIYVLFHLAGTMVHTLLHLTPLILVASRAIWLSSRSQRRRSALVATSDLNYKRTRTISDTWILTLVNARNSSSRL